MTDAEQKPAVGSLATRLAGLPCDVAIIGGGLAGNMLARQLTRQLPHVRVVMFESRPSGSFKVGESTVELASNYMLRRLGLSRYLYEHQLPKNGLRFFFDNENRNGDLFEMSEMGSYGLPLIPSFQLNRSRLETFLLEDNERDGVAVVRGARVREVQLNEQEGALHQFEVQRAGERVRFAAPWVVDASGRAGVLARKNKLRIPERHQVSAVWGRFSGVADLDDIGPASFHQRVKHTSRVLSTTHFCYPGYWIWLIPLGQGITSVGVVMERERLDAAWRTETGYLNFLRDHGALKMLLNRAKLLDLMSYSKAAYGCRQYFGKRWAVIGDAASFTDPLYSPGSDFIALENDFVSDLIARHHRGETEACEQRSLLYDKFMRYRYEGTMRLYRDLYSLLGSFELFRLKWDFDIACYYNLWLEPYLADKHLDVSYLRKLLQQQSMEMAALDAFGDLFRKTESALQQRGGYYTGNCGHYVGDFEAISASATLGSSMSQRAALRRTHGSFNRIRCRALELLHPGQEPASPLPMSHFLRGKSLS